MTQILFGVLVIWILVWVARVIEEHTDSSAMGFLCAAVIGGIVLLACGGL